MPSEVFDYAVTFEYETRQPDTHKGTVQGGNPAIRASRAIREAKRVLQPRAYLTCLCLVASRGTLGLKE